jgi:hypothetical protein
VPALGAKVFRDAVEIIDYPVDADLHRSSTRDIVADPGPLVAGTDYDYHVELYAAVDADRRNTTPYGRPPHRPFTASVPIPGAPLITSAVGTYKMVTLTWKFAEADNPVRPLFIPRLHGQRGHRDIEAPTLTTQSPTTKAVATSRVLCRPTQSFNTDSVTMVVKNLVNGVDHTFEVAGLFSDTGFRPAQRPGRRRRGTTGRQPDAGATGRAAVRVGRRRATRSGRRTRTAPSPRDRRALALRRPGDGHHLHVPDQPEQDDLAAAHTSG